MLRLVYSKLKTITYFHTQSCVTLQRVDLLERQVFVRTWKWRHDPSLGTSLHDTLFYNKYCWWEKYRVVKHIKLLLIFTGLGNLFTCKQMHKWREKNRGKREREKRGREQGRERERREKQKKRPSSFELQNCCVTLRRVLFLFPTDLGVGFLSTIFACKLPCSPPHDDNSLK